MRKIVMTSLFCERQRESDGQLYSSANVTMLLAVPAVTASSVCTYWALKLIFSAAPALLAVIRLSTGKLLASLILTPVPAAGAGALLLP